MVTEPRDERLEIRMAKSELAMLKELADADGITASDVLRLTIRRLYAERFGDKKPKAKR